MVQKSIEEDRDWEAESDARTLADAESIKNDPGRAVKAMKAAKKLAKECAQDAEAMALVAGKSPPSKKLKTQRGGVLGGLPISPYYRN